MTGHMSFVATPYATIVAESGIPYPCPMPYEHISSITVAWMEEDRIEALLRRMEGVFASRVLVVQKGTDRTLEIARDLLGPDDVLIEDEHHGYGDPSLPLAVAQVRTPWVFKIDCDEWPDDDLLRSLGHAAWLANSREDTNEGVWFPMYESFEGFRREGNATHLRLFRKYVGWPPMLHSRPMTERSLLWPYGYILHDRSLTEIMVDYLRYLDIGRDSPKWTEANLLIMRDACETVARDRGWAYVQSFDWWPTVEATIYKERKPWQHLPSFQPAP